AHRRRVTAAARLAASATSATASLTGTHVSRARRHHDRGRLPRGASRTALAQIARVSTALGLVALHLGVSQTLIENTALAATVEAEELAPVAVPARRGSPELAPGNIAGTIVHFPVLTAGVIALVKPTHAGPRDGPALPPRGGRQPGDPRRHVARPPTLGRAEGTAPILLYAVYLAVAITFRPDRAGSGIARSSQSRLASDGERDAEGEVRDDMPR
ncbi:MAG: sodium/calcium exchanger protein, partial [Solirubrobacteraceae bacterium]